MNAYYHFIYTITLSFILTLKSTVQSPYALNSLSISFYSTYLEIFPTNKLILAFLNYYLLIINLYDFYIHYI